MALSETQRDDENELKKKKVEVKMSSYVTVEGAVLLPVFSDSFSSCFKRWLTDASLLPFLYRVLLLYFFLPKKLKRFSRSFSLPSLLRMVTPPASPELGEIGGMVIARLRPR